MTNIGHDFLKYVFQSLKLLKGKLLNLTLFASTLSIRGKEFRGNAFPIA